MAGGTRVAGRGVIEGAFQLLEELSRLGDAGLTELADAAGLPKSTAHRLLDQLVAAEAVERHGGRYRMGTRLFRMGQAWAPGPSLRAAGRHPLGQLAEAVPGASVLLSVPEGGRTVVVAGYRGEPDEVFPIQPGALIWHGNTGDRLFAAPAEMDRTAERVRPPGVPASVWRRQVARAHDEGVAYDFRPPVGPAVSCVSAPLRSPAGRVVGAVTVVLLDNDRVRPYAPAVQRAARMTTANLTRLRTTDTSLASWLDEAPR
ncbi:IclR family transcriptional regulator [Streptomyces liangshanensis]|uniref:IclR family transcriptional regulator n=1 Tax=Streptomyces liangshanensis TaxID=2717324 RepID=UPI001FBA638F|nr:helix-turn-helix domain-containing protein [Streptomyces liangshanensis]